MVRFLAENSRLMPGGRLCINIDIPMLTYEEALQKLLTQVPEPKAVRVALRHSKGRVLAGSITADLDLPPFRKSFMDGYAVRSQDVARVPVQLQVVGQVAAGSQDQPEVGPRQAVQIMTGAPVPPGADAVQMVEKTRQLNGSLVELLESVSQGQNIVDRANEVREGSVVLDQGCVIGSPEMGILATFGQSEVEVYGAPTVAVMTTGDEIVDVTRRPNFGQIRNSNAFMLWSQCADLGLEATIFPVVPDDPDRTEKAVLEGLKHDLLLLTGGVSMGEHDYVHQVLGKAGVDTFFHKAAIKPGKPLLAGRKDGHLIFGLPGNPVSAFVTFELFVRPAVRQWMGFSEIQLPKVAARLLMSVRQKPGRKFFKPARTIWTDSGFEVKPIETKGSADLTGFSAANSLLVLEPEVTELKAGERPEVILLDRYFEKGN